MEESSFKTRVLAPRDVIITQTPAGNLRMVVGTEVHPRIKLRRCYPLSEAARMISVRNATDSQEPEIGILEDLTLLDDKSRTLALAELRMRYFVPIISRIVSMEELFGFLYWKVETDRGPREFVVKDVSNNVRAVDGQGLLVMDVDDCRYLVRSTGEMDEASVGWLRRHISV